jgi:hypothetical protein
MPLPNCFELFGFDFLVDENLNPIILEVRCSSTPAGGLLTVFTHGMLSSGELWPRHEEHRKQAGPRRRVFP